jgi:uncharacterized delta-60 repeat protein
MIAALTLLVSSCGYLKDSFKTFGSIKGPSSDITPTPAPTQSFIVTGSFTSGGGRSLIGLAKFNSKGEVDSTFPSGLTSLGDAGIATIAVCPNKKIMIGGNFTTFNSIPAPYLVRLNEDGSVDTTFVQTGTGLNNYVRALFCNSSGKVFVGGWFTTYNGTAAPYLAKLNSDGSHDTSFTQTGTGLDGYVYGIIEDSNGKVYVSGNHINYNGSPYRGVLRLNSNGTLDTSFVPTGAGFDERGRGIYLTSTALFVSGFMTSFDSNSSAKYMAKFNFSQVLDGTFVPTGSGFNALTAQVINGFSDKVIYFGNFTDYNGTTLKGIARLNSTGSLDTGFLGGQIFDVAPSGGVSDSVSEKTYVVGNFTTLGAQSVSPLVRLNSDGTLDTSFSISGGAFNAAVTSITQVP